MNEVSPNTTFWTAAQRAIEQARFVKLTLGKSRNRDTPQLKNIYVRPVEIKESTQLQMTFRYADRDEVKNEAPEQALAFLAEQAGGDFLAAELFTLDEQLSLQFSRKGKARLNQSAARHREPAMAQHNREKERRIAESRPYLHALGIADTKGQVVPTGQKKYKQINKFVEIIDGLVTHHPLPAGAQIVDMGSGKGYLTFALYDHLSNNLGLDVQ
ncbi:MAG: methyltransferase, partial [Bacteroidota bacterium]